MSHVLQCTQLEIQADALAIRLRGIIDISYTLADRNSGTAADSFMQRLLQMWCRVSPSVRLIFFVLGAPVIEVGQLIEV